MARLFTCGFEIGDARAEVPVNAGGASLTHLTGTPTIDTGTVRSGSRSLKCDMTAGGQQVRISQLGGMEVAQYHRCYVRFSAFPSSGAAYIMARPTGVGIKINSSGQLEAWFNNLTLSQLSAALSLNTWYRVEMMQTIRAAANDDIEFKVDGSSWYQSLNVARATTNSGNYDLGHNAAAGGCVMYLDDLAVNDSAAGIGQNGWPGPGKVVLLDPISDNARSGYVGGAGGTTNLYDAVDNKPPAGTTLAGDTNTTNISSSTSNNSTDSYSPNLATYATAGVTSADLVKLVLAVHRFGNQTTTTARNQGIQGTSNPAITEATGASAGTTAAAEYSNTWYCRQTAYANLPTVTLGTSPVIRTRRATATTNVMGVDQMGLYVEHTPIDTTVADDFNRTEDPLSDNGGWSGPIKTGDAAGETDGTKFIADGATTESAIRVDFGVQTDVEVSGVLGTIVENYLFARVADPGTATPDGYCVVALPGNVVEIYILTNGTLTRLGSSISTAVASGDTLKLTIVGSTIKAFVNGAEVGSRSDATYASGFIGIQAYNGGAFDSFAGVLASGATDYTQPVNDAAAATDATSRLNAFARSQADPVAGTDARSLKPTKANADPVAATDARTIKPGKVVADPVAGTDARSLKPGKGLAEPPAVTDASRRGAAHPLADAGALTDSAAAVRGLVGQLADSVAVTDASRRAAAKAIADSLAGTDATARAAAKMLADPVGGTDQLRKAIARTSTDAAAIVDAVATARATGVLIADSLAAADVLARAAVFARVVADAGAVTDAHSRAAGVRRTEAAAVTDALVRAAGKRLAEAGALTDVAARFVTKRVADSLAGTDASRRASARSIADALAVADSRSSLSAFLRQLADSGNVVDGATVLSGGGNFLTKEIMDAAGAVDDADTMASFARGLADAAQAADALAFAAAYRRSAADALAASDGLTKRVAQLRVEALAGVDSITRAWAARRVIADVAAVLDLVSPSTASSTGFVKLLEESLAVDDELRSALAKQLVEGLGIVDALERRRALVVAEALEIADVSIRSSGVVRVLADALVIDDEISRAAGARGQPSYLVLGSAVSGLGLGAGGTGLDVAGGDPTQDRATGGSGTMGLADDDESEIDL